MTAAHCIEPYLKKVKLGHTHLSSRYVQKLHLKNHKHFSECLFNFMVVLRPIRFLLFSQSNKGAFFCLGGFEFKPRSKKHVQLRGLAISVIHPQCIAEQAIMTKFYKNRPKIMLSVSFESSKTYPFALQSINSIGALLTLFTMAYFPTEFPWGVVVMSTIVQNRIQFFLPKKICPIGLMASIANFGSESHEFESQ